MRIIVLMKQVLNSEQIAFYKHAVSGSYLLVRNQMDTIMNYDDGNALEMALQRKEQYPDTHITVLSMGPPGAEDMLRECLALGADQAILVTDERMIGADTAATSVYLSYALRKIERYDLILAGYQSQDGRTGQVGPMVAERLGVPQITYATKFYQQGERLIGVRQLDGIEEKVITRFPCVVVIAKQKYCLRGMMLSGIRKALKKEICIWSLEDICGKDAQEAADLVRTAVTEITKAQKKRKKKIVKFEDCQNEILTDIIREVQKSGC